MSATVSAKIPRHLREKLRQKEVDVSVVVRNVLEQEIIRLEREELKLKLDSLRKSLSGKISPRDVVKAVRSSHDERL